MHDVLKGLRGYIALSFVWAAVLGAMLFITRRPSSEPIEIVPPPSPGPTGILASSPTPGPLSVDVAGAVKLPGVYTLPRGSLVVDAIAAAGGPATEADLDRINKAMALQDGTQVFVPRIAQPTPILVNPSVPTPVTRAGQVTVTGKLVNINTASLQDLETLPGVGPVIAQKIIDGRPYGALEDLMNVDRIGQATFDKLKDLITVR